LPSPASAETEATVWAAAAVWAEAVTVGAPVGEERAKSKLRVVRGRIKIR